VGSWDSLLSIRADNLVGPVADWDDAGSTEATFDVGWVVWVSPTTTSPKTPMSCSKACSRQQGTRY
jgi:hypothetical protein